jgi:hypothetical protein
MRSIIFLFLTIIFFSSCRQSAISTSFSTADSLVIHFKNEQQGEITRTVQTAETKAISRVIEFIDGEKSPHYKCGYDGKMFFFNKGIKMQEVDFKIKDEACNHFAFLINGELVGTKMSSEAVDFFDALEKGLPVYW